MFAIATLELDGGGRIGLCPLPGASGNLDTDVEAVAAWKAEIVVSLTERAEMEAAGAGDLGTRLQAAGVLWRHLPIADYGVPQGETAAQWLDLGPRLHACLDGKGAILLHCLGGRGRSGMVALRLTVERGEDPDAGLMRLRAVRTGAVETDAQRVWASAGFQALRR
jgi:protein-tyrosine phosphatase